MITLLENDLYRIEIESVHGTIVSLIDKAAGIELIGEKRLAGNFRLLLPVPELHANYLVGGEQCLTAAEAAPDTLTLRWDAPLTNGLGAYDVNVSMTIAFEGEAIVFRLEVENRSRSTLAEAWYPVLGGMLGLGNEHVRRNTCLLPANDPIREMDIFRRFGAINELGTPFPEWLFTYPAPLSMPWCDLYNRDIGRGVYFAAHDTVPRFKGVRFALHPGCGRGRIGDDWPRPGEIAEHTPVGVVANWFHFPYAAPGTRFEGPAVVVRFHDGDWRGAATIYRDWFKSHFPIADPRGNWMRADMTACQNTMFMLPEGNVNLTFAGIPQWAADARDHGVGHVLISGWNVGGHDAGYPDYTPEPRLGTWKDLEAGIRACHDIGVKVSFFVNIHPADSATDWFKDELHRYVSLNVWGDHAVPAGWGMGTLGARLGQTHRHLKHMSAGVPEVRDLFIRQMRKLVEIGADGLHIDKCHPVGLDFNPRAEGGPAS